MGDDTEFETYLRGIMKPTTDRDWVRRNYPVLKKAYFETGVVNLPQVEQATPSYDRYGDLD